MAYILLGAGLVVWALGLWPWRNPAVMRWVLRGLALVVGLFLAGAGGYALWARFRPQPPPVRETLFEGIEYRRIVRIAPRPAVIHVATVDLAAPGVALVGTPPGAGGKFAARTTIAFLREFGVQLAVNGSFFEPWHSDGPLDYYPHAGDPVDVIGPDIVEGRVCSPPRAGYTALCLDQQGAARFGEPDRTTVLALPGRELLVREGRGATEFSSWSDAEHPQPRTAVALDAAGTKLLFVVVDGRQGSYSAGATLAELVAILLEAGAETALHLDGGGSCTLVAEGASGEVRTLNSPINHRIVGRQRPVANHLGVRARRLQ